MAKVLSNLTDALKSLKPNQAMVFQSERKEYWFWITESGTMLIITDYQDDLPSYFKVESLKNGIVTVQDNHFHRTVRHKLQIDYLNPNVFYMSVARLKKQHDSVHGERTNEVKEVSNG